MIDKIISITKLAVGLRVAFKANAHGQANRNKQQDPNHCLVVHEVSQDLLSENCHG
jgi:hypothetical protein